MDLVVFVVSTVVAFLIAM
jgi:hypothetical protein